MTTNDPGKILALLRLGKALAANPTHQGRTEAFDLLAQIAADEQSQETPLYPTVSRNRLRRVDPHNEKRISSEQTTVFTVNDQADNRVIIMLETAQENDRLQLSGQLSAPDTHLWDNFTVLLSQNSTVQDFSDVTGTNRFSLRLLGPGIINLKIISAQREVILLEDLQVVFD